MIISLPTERAGSVDTPGWPVYQGGGRHLTELGGYCQNTMGDLAGLVGRNSQMPASGSLHRRYAF